MKVLRSKRLRPLGSLVGGVAIALAGGIGVAVGVYSLPDPQHAAAGVGGEVYASSQRANAVWKERIDGGTRELRLQVDTGPHAGAGAQASASEGADVGASGDEHVWFWAVLQTCWDDGWCDWERSWNATVPLDAFVFDAAMDGARFVATVHEPDSDEKCAFDIEWKATGTPAPFAGSWANSNLNPWSGRAEARGFAEVSRVALARIDACFTAPLESVPGYLSRGLTQAFGRGGLG